MIVMILAVIGAVQVYQYVTRADTCDGGGAWVETSNALFADLDREGKSLNPQTSTRAEVLAYVDNLREAARAQVESTPPVAGEELNAAWATYYSMMADSFDAVANGQAPPYSDSELLDRATEILGMRDEFNEEC